MNCWVPRANISRNLDIAWKLFGSRRAREIVALGESLGRDRCAGFAVLKRECCVFITW